MRKHEISSDKSNGERFRFAQLIFRVVNFSLGVGCAEIGAWLFGFVTPGALGVPPPSYPAPRPLVLKNPLPSGVELLEQPAPFDLL